MQLSGDTLKGLVNLREWNRNPRSFAFKPTASSPEITLTTATTVYLNIEGIDIYKRYVGPVSMNYLEMSRLPVDVVKIDRALARMEAGGGSAAGRSAGARLAAGAGAHRDGRRPAVPHRRGAHNQHRHPNRPHHPPRPARQQTRQEGREGPDRHRHAGLLT